MEASYVEYEDKSTIIEGVEYRYIVRVEKFYHMEIKYDSSKRDRHTLRLYFPEQVTRTVENGTLIITNGEEVSEYCIKSLIRTIDTSGRLVALAGDDLANLIDALPDYIVRRSTLIIGKQKGYGLYRYSSEEYDYHTYRISVGIRRQNRPRIVELLESFNYTIEYQGRGDRNLVDIVGIREDDIDYITSMLLLNADGLFRIGMHAVLSVLCEDTSTFESMIYKRERFLTAMRGIIPNEVL